MSDFTGIGDWDLQAVVRGCTNGFFTTIMDNPPTCFSPLTIQQDDFVLSAFPDLFETTTVLNELEELYKPFYPILNPLSPQTILSPSISVTSGGEREPEKEPLTGPPVVAAAAATTAIGVKYKRRKNQHKRVVLQVAAEGLSSDVWAWRKYGQKPIKGSPFPRSYYRCSTLKGCLARKQVERNPSDPEMFVITYTAEHCHGQPTRKNSLAGTTRHRFSTPKSSTAGDPNTPPAKDSSSPVSSAVVSPPTPSSATIADESSQERIKKERTEEEDKQHFIFDMMLNDDFLMGFDELDRPLI